MKYLQVSILCLTYRMREGRDAKFQNWLGVRPCEGAKRPRGGGGGGVPPPTVGSFFIWGLEIVQFGAYL